MEALRLTADWPVPHVAAAVVSPDGSVHTAGDVDASFRIASIAKIDVGAQATLVTFHNDDFPDPAGLIAYVERLNQGGKDTAKLRPDMKLVINRAWGDPLSRLNGLFQLTKGLSGIVRKAAKAKKAA